MASRKRRASGSEPSQAVPASLLQLVQQISDADVHNVAPDLARDAQRLIEAAWSGSMCEKVTKQKTPLAAAIERSTPALDAAAMAYIDQ